MKKYEPYKRSWKITPMPINEIKHEDINYGDDIPIKHDNKLYALTLFTTNLVVQDVTNAGLPGKDCPKLKIICKNWREKGAELYNDFMNTEEKMRKLLTAASISEHTILYYDPEKYDYYTYKNDKYETKSVRVFPFDLSVIKPLKKTTSKMDNTERH